MIFTNYLKGSNMKTNQYLINFYNNYDEDSRLALKHGSVEFLTTMRYIEKHIRSGDRVLEIGAGTGRYSHALARQGYTVDAVELVEHNIDIFRKNIQSNENITVTQGNAMDLSAFHDNEYDITLLLGPLYHLYNKDDKQRALQEAIRVTKQGGVIFAAYVISDGCLLDEGFNRGNINVAEYIEKGLIDSQTFAANSEPKDLFELVRKENIDNLMSIFPVTRLHYVAADGCALFMREAIDTMDNDTFDLYMKYHFATCEREDLLGISSHAIDIFRK
jgi:ubiquinone/menaquinone biosynthesis C-methylase UbiE